MFGFDSDILCYSETMKKFNYLITLTTVFVLPTIAAGFFLSEFISLKTLAPFIFTVTIIGSIWDVWAARLGKHDRVWLWQFNSRNTIRIKLLGLPIEEYLFYVVSSVYMIFMWEGIKLIVTTHSFAAYSLVLILGTWTLLAILIPYWFAPKGDRFIN